MDGDDLLACLSDKSRSIGCLASNINHGEGEQQLPLVQGNYSYCASNDMTSLVETSHTVDVESEIQPHFVREPKDILISVEQRPVHEVIKFTDLTLSKVPDTIWLYKLCEADICCRILTLKRLTAKFSRVELLLKESCVAPSTFIVELGKLLPQGITSINEASHSPLESCKCLKLFYLKQFIYSGTIRHVRAELSIVNNDFEHPLPFVSGLPVGIECDITLHNITNDH